MNTHVLRMPAVILLVTALGCSKPQSVEEPTAEVSVDRSLYVLSEEPDGVVGVLEARETIKNDDEVTLIGHVGGSAEPWIEGRAAFRMVDAAMAIQAETAESHAAPEGQECDCPSCKLEQGMAKSSAFVKVVDESGRTLGVDARKLFEIDSEDLIIVSGKAQRDEDENLTVLATGIFVRR